MKISDLKLQVSEAINACQDKKAEDVTLLELEPGTGAFTDYFIVCSGSNPHQVQAIADEVERRLELIGQRVTHHEGYRLAEWILLDYVDFVVHVFSNKARKYYDLERLWKSAKRIEPADLVAKPKRATARKTTQSGLKKAAKKTTAKSVGKTVAKPAKKRASTKKTD